jgi:hypothetical protein
MSFILLISMLILNVALFPHHSHADASTSMDGFIIEADRVEGVLGLPGIIAGESSNQNNKIMLHLNFSKATIYGMKLTKVVNTVKGPLTIQFKSTGPVELQNMSVDVTKIQFGGIYLPNKLGEIGMRDVRLVAHKQTADKAFLPALVASIAEQGITIDTTGDKDENLKAQTNEFKKMIEVFKDHKLNPPLDELNKILNPNKTNDNQESKDKSSKEPSDSPTNGETKNNGGKQTGDSNESEKPPTDSTSKGSDKTPKDPSNSNENANPAGDASDSKGNAQTSKDPSPSNGTNHQPEVSESKQPDDSTNSDDKNSTVDQPAPTEPPSGDSDSGGISDNTKHGGILDLLKIIIP